MRHRYPRERGPLPRAAGAPGLYHQGHPGGGGELRQDHRRRPEDLRGDAGRAQGPGGEDLLRGGRLQSSILQQAGQSMLAQANQATQGVLSLLQ